MTPAERKDALTNRPPESQKAILDKVNEYEALDPDQRELRLRVTELHWYLWPLLTTPATNRAPRLALIPEADRTLIEARLQQWDALTPGQQQQFLASEITVRYLTASIGEKLKLRRTLSPEERTKLEDGLTQWGAMPPEQRQAMTDRLAGFFNFSIQEKQKVLNTLSDPERRQIEKALREFGNLTQAQRDRCINSFAQFASLTPEERQQFLDNAELWKLMSPGDRQAWRELVKVMPRKPPLPPNLAHRLRPVTLSPYSTNPAPAVATNRQ